MKILVKVVLIITSLVCIPCARAEVLQAGINDSYAQPIDDTMPSDDFISAFITTNGNLFRYIDFDVNAVNNDVLAHTFVFDSLHGTITGACLTTRLRGRKRQRR